MSTETTTKQPELLRQAEVDDIFIAFERGHADAGGRMQYDWPTAVTVKRSSTCRSCGEKMPKGTEAIAVSCDFSGNGSWGCVRIVIHRERCVAVGPRY